MIPGPPSPAAFRTTPAPTVVPTPVPAAAAGSTSTSTRPPRYCASDEATPQQLWDWQANIDSGIAELDAKRASTTDWIGKQREEESAWIAMQSDPKPQKVPIPAKQYGKEWFDDAQQHPAVDVCTIQGFNGVVGGCICDWNNASETAHEYAWVWLDQEYDDEGKPVNNVQYGTSACD